MKLIKIFFSLTIFLVSFNISLASVPMIIEYELVNREEVLIQTRNLLNKSVGENIDIFYDQRLIGCEIKRYNDFYGMRQFRCFVPCVPFIESQEGDCYQLDDKEDNYFIISVNLENPNIINVQFHYGQYSYFIETENEKGEVLEVRDDVKVYDDYIYFFSKNIATDMITNQPIIDEKPINNFDNEVIEEVNENKETRDLRFFYVIISVLLLIVLLVAYKKERK